MKKVLCVIFLFLLISHITPCHQEKPNTMDELINMAKEFVNQLEKGDYAGSVKNFDVTMTRVVPPEKMKEVWEMLIKQAGELIEQIGVRTESIPKYDIVYVTCEFEKTTLDVKVVFNKQKQIAGQFFTQPPAQYKTPDYVDRNSFIEKEVEFGVQGWFLPGTLSIPNGKGPFPALVLVHGSGPNDRDESVGSNKPFRDLAWGLASNNIAVLRYDKRTKVHGKKMVAEKNKTFTVYEETIEDALSAAELLRNSGKISKENIFILGHSLGGTLIPRIAPLDPDASGFIIMAGATRPIEDLYLEQVKYIFMLDGNLAKEEKEKLDQAEKTVEKIKNLKQSDSSQEQERILGANPGYWLDLKGYNPAISAKSTKRPLLILQGGRDYQVTEKDFKNWKESLDQRKNVTFRLYPALNHLFIPGKGPSTPSEYQKAGHVDETVIKDIINWIEMIKE